MGASKQCFVSSPGTGARLADEVTRALSKSGYRCLKDVAVAVYGSCVILRGTLPSYFAKQFVLATVQAVPGVGPICDVTRVVRPDSGRRSA